MGDGGRQKDRVLAAFDRSNIGPLKSPLTRWMRRNHDALLSRIDGAQVDWVSLADLFAQANLTDQRGKPPSPETARKAWFRTRQAVAAARLKRRGYRPEPAPEELAPGIRALPQEGAAVQPGAAIGHPTAVETDPPEDGQPRFQLATLRGMSAATTAPAPEPGIPAPTPEPEKQSVDDVLADFMGQAPPVGFRPKINPEEE